MVKQLSASTFALFYWLIRFYSSWRFWLYTVQHVGKIFEVWHPKCMTFSNTRYDIFSARFICIDVNKISSFFCNCQICYTPFTVRSLRKRAKARPMTICLPASYSLVMKKMRHGLSLNCSICLWTVNVTKKPFIVYRFSWHLIILSYHQSQRWACNL